MLELEIGDIVRLELGERTMEIPVWIVPGFTDDTVTLELGYGRESVGRIGNGIGFNTYKVRSSTSMYYGNGATVSKTGVKYDFASTQDHWSLEDRPIYREGTIQDYQEHPDFVAEMVEFPEPQSLWEEHSYKDGYQWGMAIDLNVCTGCNACSIACQSENNIPIVGKKQVAEGREMHWIRMDRYFAGDVADPEMVVQPVTCMHCENAPCETVCPVNATVHDDEGLNVQVYNRCIGTRYCSNNCPYKVRRFNFFNYTRETPEVQKIGKNPDVTVRTRGVMEKCTYCLQRIQRKKIQAKVENREIRTDEVVVACQQTCPTDAIVFGNINDPESRVSLVKSQNRDYKMLAHLNTQPRTSYQAKLRNPNPALADHVTENS
jgi:molybdopterin-containing oxidoreductase family iron-sulfur binding subunit